MMPAASQAVLAPDDVAAGNILDCKLNLCGAAVPFAILVGLMMDNFSEMAITIDSLEVFHKQRASRFYPAWAFALPTSLLRIPYSFIMAGVSTCIVYYVMGFDPNPGR